jgi:hypothetical protein
MLHIAERNASSNYLYCPDEAPGVAVADQAVVGELPSGMIKALGPASVVGARHEIVAAIRRAHETPQ